jgi:hypothetical protein
MFYRRVTGRPGQKVRAKSKTKYSSKACPMEPYQPVSCDRLFFDPERATPSAAKPRIQGEDSAKT